MLPALVRPVFFLPLLLGLAFALSRWLARLDLPGADEGALLTNAVKLLHGGVYYRDVDAYPFPLASYLLAGWMGVFGEHVAVSRGLATLFYLATVAALYASALRLVGLARAALFGLFLLCVKYLAWPSFTAYTYWDVAFAFACVSVALLLGHRFRGASLRLAAAGVAAGLAVLAKQNVGIYLAGAAGGALLLARPLLAVERTGARVALREVAAFGGGVAAPFVVAGAYFAKQGLLGRMLESGLVRPFTGYLPTSGIAFLEPIAWWKLGTLRDHASLAYFPHRPWRLLYLGPLANSPLSELFWGVGELFSRMLYTSIPLAFLGAALLWLLARRAGALARERGAIWLATLAGAVFLSAFPRADYAHVISVYPLVGLLLYVLWARVAASNNRWAFGRLEWMSVALLAGGCSVLAGYDREWHAYREKLERADVFVSAQDAWIGSVVRYVEAETAPEDPIFTYGQLAEFYFLTGRQFSWPFAQLYPGQTGDDKGEALLERIRREPPKLVLRAPLDWPGLPPLAASLPRLDRWVNYDCERVADVFERFPPVVGDGIEWEVLSVLRPCSPRQPCRRFVEFMATQGFPPTR